MPLDACRTSQGTGPLLLIRQSRDADRTVTG
jgi:hypothetical protein